MTSTDATEQHSESGGQGSLRKRATRGAFWSMLSYGGRQGLRFIGNLILTRLLFQEAFGLMALVSVFQTGLQLFSDIGIGPGIVQHKRGDDPAFLNTAWTLQAIRGAALCLIGIAGAVPFAHFYGEPQLRGLIPFVMVTALLNGFNSTKLFTAQRHLEVERLAIIELTSGILGLGAMITWAVISPSVWALAGGSIVSALTKLVLSHVTLTGIRNRFQWDRDAFGGLIRFGRWVFLSTVLTFLVGHSDRLVFGKLIPVGMLGVYSIGATLAALPSQLLGSLGNQILFPVCSRVWNENGDLPRVFRRMRTPLLVASGWMLSGFIAGGQTIIDIFYDDRYSEAGWVVQLVSMSSWFAIMLSTAGPVLMARGQVYHIVTSNVAKLVGMVVLIPLGYAHFDFPGAVAAYAACDVVKYVVIVWALHWTGIPILRGDLGLTLVVTASALAAGYAARWASQAGVNVFAEALVVFVVTTVLWLPIGYWAWRARRG